MTVSFNSIPANLRVPFVGAEFDASQAQQGPALLAYRHLIIGQITSAATVAANSLTRCTSAEQARTYCGRGSQLARMAAAHFKINKFTELWLGALDDDGGATAASGTITVSGTATEDGTIALYLGGIRIEVAVTSGDAATAVAAAIEAAVDLVLDAAVSASVASAVVTLTHRQAGVIGNGYDMRDSFRYGEELPAGIALAYVALASGATEPALTTLIANMGDVWFHTIAHPYIDATNLSAIEAELSDRFGPLRMIDGLAITSADDTHANLVTLGSGRNSQHNCIIAQDGANPLTPRDEFAAEVGALVAKYGSADPARPFQTLAMVNAIGGLDTDQFTIAERNLLLFDGVGTTKAAAAGTVALDRIITTYQTAASGADDTSYLDATTLLTLMYLRYTWRTRMQTRYPRHKLAGDDVQPGPGQYIMTPLLGKAEAVAWFKEMRDLGLVEGLAQFKRDLVVERSETDPNRLDVLLPPDLINQLMITAGKIEFRL